MADAVATTGSTSIDIAAPPEAVYALVADIARMGEYSPECARCEWLDGASGPAAGARFQGYNAVGDFEWDITCEVTAAEPGAVFEFTGPVGEPSATTWRYTFADNGRGGTTLTESFDAPMLADPNTTSGSIPGRHQMLLDGIAQTVARIKDAAEA